MKMEKLADGLTLIKKSDGYYANIILPMFAPDMTFLYTSNKRDARKKALDLFERMKNYK